MIRIVGRERTRGLDDRLGSTIADIDQHRFGERLRQLVEGGDQLVSAFEPEGEIWPGHSIRQSIRDRATDESNVWTHWHAVAAFARTCSWSPISADPESVCSI